MAPVETKIRSSAYLLPIGLLMQTRYIDELYDGDKRFSGHRGIQSDSKESRALNACSRLHIRYALIRRPPAATVRPFSAALLHVQPLQLAPEVLALQAVLPFE